MQKATFKDALKFCMLLPGHEAQQIGDVYLMALHGILGGIVSGFRSIFPLEV
jgi:chromate transport protein ChrA